jgi:hypothetical protein
MPATKIREAGKPATKTIRAKAPAPKGPAAPAKTPADWKNEEANETESRSYRGAVRAQPVTPEQCVVNDNYSIGNWSHPSWVDEDENRLTVSLWFPTQKAAIDYPEDEAERNTKVEVFKKLKVAYVGVLPGEPLKVDEARKQLIAQGAKINN